MPPRPVSAGILAQLGLVAQFGCCLHVFTEYVAELTMCVGPSMVPTFNPTGDIVLTEAVSVRLGKVKRGDVVVSRSPSKPGVYVCKRIVGMPGDRVCENPTKYPRRYRTVPRNHVWLQGDNLYNSTDSRSYGAVPMPLLKSRVVMKCWPPTEIGRVPCLDPGEPDEAAHTPKRQTPSRTVGEAET